MEGTHPGLPRLRELQKTLTSMKKNDLVNAIGVDGRNRTSVRPFGASTSRNTPRANEFLLSQAKWNRCLIKPDVGLSIACFDYVQQEFAIAAVFSGDKAMLEAYQTGDAYMGTAIQAGAAPKGATKKTHKEVRGKFKTCLAG